MDNKQPPRQRDEGFAARKARAEELARVTVANRAKAAQAVQRMNDANRRFKTLSDAALDASLKRTESILQEDKNKVDYQQFRQARADWKELLEERASREDERRRVLSEVQMNAAREQQQDEQELRPYQGLPWYKLVEKIEALQQERDRLAHEARFDASLRSAVTITGHMLDAALEEKKLRTEGFKRPVRKLDEHNHEASEAFKRHSGMSHEH